MTRRALLLAFAALSACTLEPKDLRPALPVPPSWPSGDAYLRQSEAALPSVNYRDVLKDARLQALVDQALANNRDLRIAVENIAAARAQYRIQRSELLPEVDASGRYSRSGTGTRTAAPSGGGSAGSAGSTGSGNAASSSLSLDVGTTAFEIDLFGRVRSLTREAQNRYFATEAAARATRLTLVATVANDWLRYAADRTLLQVARATAQSATTIVRLTEARLKGGVAPRTDLTQAQGILATALSDLAEQTTLVAQDANALQLVVGAPIDPALLPTTIDEAAGRIAGLPAGVSSDVLLRRPDVVQAEYTLRAANADIGAARAALFPRLSLTALAGVASAGLSSLFTGGAFSYSIAPSVNCPIFRAGAGRAGVAYSRAQRAIALASYERTIQTAFSEVADALARRGTLADQLAAAQLGVTAANGTLTLANARYRGGIDPFLNTLDAQRTLYTAQRSYVATALAGGQNLVRLYQVLGGDSTLGAANDGPRLISERPTVGRQ